MQLKKITLAVALAASSALTSTAVLAEDSPISGTLTFVTDYVSRGFSYTAGRPAVQASLDYSHDSGFYAGVWGSSVSDKALGIGSHGVEFDVYLGYATEIGGFGVDVGAVRYIFPSDISSKDTDSTDLYIGVSWEMLGFTYYRDIDLDVNYYELGAAVPLTDSWMLEASYGHSDPDDGDSYNNWKLGVTTSYAGLDFGLHYVDSDADAPDYDSTVIFSVSKSF